MDKFAIPKENVLYLIVGLAVIILGCLFLMGGGADSPEVFNYALFSFSRTLFSFSRMYVAPLLIVGGFVIELVVLLRRRPITLFRNRKDKEGRN